MLSLSQSSASTGVRPQLVGQVETTSTIEKPLPASWVWKAFLMAALALLGNVMNTAARSFYQAHGVASVEPAYEKQAVPEAVLLLLFQEAEPLLRLPCPEQYLK